MAFKGVFVGINKYVDPGIPELSGARRDAMAVGLEFRIRSLNRGLGHHCVAPEF